MSEMDATDEQTEEEEEEEECESEFFEGNISYSMSEKSTPFPKLFSGEALKHRLFLASSDVDNKTRHGYDIVTDFLQRKKYFLRLMKSKNKVIANRKMTSSFCNMEEQIKSTRKDTCMKIPSHIPCFTEVVNEDPDEKFFGTYNWYYTGGCLQDVLINENHHLAYVGGKLRDKFYVAPVKCDSLWHVDTSDLMNVTASPGKEIFQIVGAESSPHNFIAVRQKYTCMVYCCKNRTIKECFKVNFDIPFSSFDISSVNKELCTMSVNNGLSYWDINRQEEPISVYFPSDNDRQDRWHNLWYTADPSVVSVASRQSLKWMDRRSTNVNNSVKLAHFKSIMDGENISVHFASKRNPYLMYVGTNVHLLMVDIRSPVSVVHRWPHHFMSPPLYSSVISCDEDMEMAVIGNHSPGNVVLALSNKSEAYPLTELPTRNDSLLSYQASGLCLNPSIKPRIMSSLTGLTSLKDNKFSNVEVLSLTAASDIFSQALLDNNTDTNGFTDLCKTSDTLSATDRLDLTELYNGLSNKHLQQISVKKTKRVRKQAWQLSREEMMEYKDDLSSIILEQWN